LSRSWQAWCHKFKHDLFPLLVQEARLEKGFLKALVLLKNSAIMLLRLVEDIKEERFGSLEGGGLLG
jgi:hypothetical protein